MSETDLFVELINLTQRAEALHHQLRQALAAVDRDALGRSQEEFLDTLAVQRTEWRELMAQPPEGRLEPLGRDLDGELRAYHARLAEAAEARAALQPSLLGSTAYQEGPAEVLDLPLAGPARRNA